MCESVMSRAPRWFWCMAIAGAAFGLGYWILQFGLRLEWLAR